jgi:hypothetical protein
MSERAPNTKVEPKLHPKPEAHEDKPLRVIVVDDLSEKGVHILNQKPWWQQIPTVLYWTFMTLIFPIRAVVFAAEAAVTFGLLAIGVGIYMWATGHITDQQVTEQLLTLGGRLVNILRNAHILPGATG